MANAPRQAIDAGDDTPVFDLGAPSTNPRGEGSDRTPWAADDDDLGWLEVFSRLRRHCNELCAVSHVTFAMTMGSVPREATPPPELRRVVLQFVHEALTNTLRHARARGVTLDAIFAHGALILTFRDDGMGMASMAVPPDHGLDVLDQRIRNVGGTLAIASPEEGGTLLVARLPLARPMDAELRTP